MQLDRVNSSFAPPVSQKQTEAMKQDGFGRTSGRRTISNMRTDEYFESAIKVRLSRAQNSPQISIWDQLGRRLSALVHSPFWPRRRHFYPAGGASPHYRACVLQAAVTMWL